METAETPETITITLASSLRNLFDRVARINHSGPPNGFGIWQSVFGCVAEEPIFHERLSVVIKACSQLGRQIEALDDPEAAKQIWRSALGRLSSTSHLTNMHEPINQVRGRIGPADLDHLVTLDSRLQRSQWRHKLGRTTIVELAESVRALKDQVNEAQIGEPMSSFLLQQIERLLVMLKNVELYGLEAAWEANGQLMAAWYRYEVEAKSDNHKLSDAFKSVVTKCYHVLAAAIVVHDGPKAIGDMGQFLIEGIVRAAN